MKKYLLIFILVLSCKTLSCSEIEELNLLDSSKAIKQQLNNIEQSSNRLLRGFKVVEESLKKLDESIKTQYLGEVAKKCEENSLLSKILKEELIKLERKSQIFINHCKEDPENQILKLEQYAQKIGNSNYKIEQNVLALLPHSLYIGLTENNKSSTEVEIQKILDNIRALKKNALIELLYLNKLCKLKSTDDCVATISELFNKTLNTLILHYAIVAKLRQKLPT